MKLLKTFSVIILLVNLLYSCRKDEKILQDSSAKLNFSTDSLSFDTVFTTVGTVTKNFRVYNPYKETIEISSIRLNGGEQSNFRINVDGRSGAFHQHVQIAPQDSMYVFVEATIDPTNETNPFVISDYIEFNTNGNNQRIELVAWGQNARYYTPTTFSRSLPDYTCLTGECSDDIAPVDIRWDNTLPYVIYGYVVIDSLDKLTIEAGTEIYFHQNGGLWVYADGTLKVNGTKEEPVVFQGDRLEAAYQDKPGQWDRIWINEGGLNEINYAVIRNAFIGLQVEPLPFRDTSSLDRSLSIKNTIIENCSGIGLLTALYNIDAENLLIGDCGQYNAVIQSAGNYRFTHCTFANYFSEAARETPAVFIQNSYVNALRTQYIQSPNVDLYNSLVYGQNDVEFAVEALNNETLDLDFRNCLFKTDFNFTDGSRFKDIIKNPAGELFKATGSGNYALTETSAARNQGSVTIANSVPQDQQGNSRLTDGKPDLGYLEYQP
jgi:hypothetical protein